MYFVLSHLFCGNVYQQHNKLVDDIILMLQRFTMVISLTWLKIDKFNAKEILS